MSKDLNNLSKDELIDYINDLRKQLNNEKYGLYFDRKATPEETVEKCKKSIPILIHDSKKDIINGGQENLIIEGDNYECLTALNELSQEFVDVIYIDPPYNTGAKDWLYNNNYVDSEDGYRHTKWLNFMEKRLVLAKNLLKETGTIIAAIDHYEIFNLGLLMDQVFGENNKYGIITVVHKPEGRQFTKGLNPTNEFYLIYGKNRQQGRLHPVPLTKEKMSEFPLEDQYGNYRLEPYMRLKDGEKNNREYKPNNYYPIYVSEKLDRIDLVSFEGAKEIYPIYHGIEKSWSRSKELCREDIENGEIVAQKSNSSIEIFKKYRSQESIKTHWIKKEYNATVFGTKVLTDVIGPNSFNFPKSLYAVEDALKITSDRDSVVLDFFAGSGTTAQAVLELNKEDGGHRKFILCTNNENNIMTGVCYPRVKTVITGIRPDGSKYSDGLPGSVRYFETGFVDDRDYKEQTKVDLVEQCDGLLCISEDAYDKCDYGKFYNIYEDAKKEKGIAIFNEDFIESYFKEMLNSLKKFNFKENVIYYFKQDSEQDPYIEEIVLKELPDAEAKPIPSKIYEIYRHIADDLRKTY